jgi:carbamoyl-phosphate synthase large subunit
VDPTLIGINVAVTGLLVLDNPQPGVAVARSLRHAPEFQGQITALALEPLSNGAFDLELFDHAYVLPYPCAGKEALLRRIQEIHKTTPLDVIIPCLDSEVSLYAQLSAQLAALGIRLFLPPEASIKRCGKSQLYEFGLEHGFRVPRTLTLGSAAELKSRVFDTGVPFVLKALLNDARVCHSVEEGLVEYHKLFAKWGYPILLQEFVFGEEWDMMALCARDSSLLGAAVMKKLGLTEKGKAMAGVTVDSPELVALSGNILRTLGWVGPAECEFIREQKSDEYFLVEVNNRFPSWLYLATVAGQNLPLALVRLALGQDVQPLPPCADGKLFLRTVRESAVPYLRLLDFSTTGEIHA